MTSALPAADKISQRLLAKTEQSSVPVDLESIIGCWKDLSIVYEELDGAGYLLPIGRLGTEIIVNKNERRPRQRFTIAHELGHWVLGLMWQKKTGEFRQPVGLSREAIEKWCDSFATNLLMPRAAVERYFGDQQGATLIQFVVNAPGDFQVSEEALYIRLWEVQRIQVVVLKREGAGFVMERNYGDESSGRLVSKMAQMPEVKQQLCFPYFFFTLRSEDGTLPVSGKQLDRSGGTSVILAILHPRL